VTEEPLFFPSNGYRLFGMLHRPRRSAHGGILFCHGFTGHHIESHRLFVQAARFFQSEGFLVLRFDYRGSGNSEGEFSDGTPATHVEDAATAWSLLSGVDELRGRRSGVLGFSLGGCVAACLAEKVPQVAAVALWAAVADPPSTGPSREARPLPDGRYDLGGLCVTAQFRADYDASRPTEALARSGVRSVLIAHGAQDASVPVAQARLWDQLPGADGRSIERLEFPDVGHLFERVEIRHELYHRTASWFRRELAGSAGDGGE
jgi:pimeloyl-ACP methyl ester carboxylesterase